MLIFNQFLEIIEQVKEEIVKVAPPSKSTPHSDVPPPSPMPEKVTEQITQVTEVETHSEPVVTRTIEKTEVFIQQQQQPDNGKYFLF